MAAKGIRQFIDVDDLVSLPGELAATFRPSNIIAKGYPWWTAQGDTSAFFALFFDNLATQLSLAGMAIFAVGLPAAFVWEHFFGGVGLSIFLGNLYYTLQASKVAMKTGKMDTCAQPYGINTPGAIAKTFGVLGPVFWAETAAGVDSQTAALKAWETACVANFFGGLFEFLGAFVAPLVAKNVPQAVFLVPMGGIGMTWLGINPLMGILSSGAAQNPMVGFIPFVLIWISFFGTSKLFGKLIPASGVAVVVGIILNLLAQTADWQEYAEGVSRSTNFVSANGIAVPGWSHTKVAISEYGSLVLGLAFTNFIGTYSCNISARKGGDVYSPMESMMVDGIGSMLGAVFGSPYGTTVYIGHVAYKKMGATRGYSLANGIVYLIFGLCGLHALLNAIVPYEIVAGILVVIGFSMAAQVIEVSPKRWYPAVLVGLSICFSDFIVGGFQVNKANIQLISNGYVWLSLFYTWFLAMLTDRWYLAASGVFMLMTLASVVGLIHAPKMSVLYNEYGTIKGAEGMFGAESGMPGWKFILMYSLAAILCLALHFVQKKSDLLEDPEEEDFRVVQEKEIQGQAEETNKQREEAAKVPEKVAEKVDAADSQTQRAAATIGG